MKLEDKPKFTYNKVKIIDVYDTDTVTAVIDFGFTMSQIYKFRLARIDAFEVRGKDKARGRKARDWLANEIYGKIVTIETYKDLKGKYGRYLCEIWFKDVCLNDELVKKGFAHYREY